jgi:hypothetical protein
MHVEVVIMDLQWSVFGILDSCVTIVHAKVNDLGLSCTLVETSVSCNGVQWIVIDYS